jgi:hypothetical protein
MKAYRILNRITENYGGSIMAGKWKEVVRPTPIRTHFDHSARPIEDILEEPAQEIPQEKWDKLPGDLNDNLDHYLYGVPKK